MPDASSWFRGRMRSQTTGMLCYQHFGVTMEMSAALGAAACREQCIVVHLPLLLRVPHERGGGPPGQLGQHYNVAALHVSFELCLQVDCVA